VKYVSVLLVAGGVVVAWAGCSGAGDATRATLGPRSASPPPARGSERGTPIKRYTPSGCSYEVVVPESAQEPMLGGTSMGRQPAPANVHVSWAGPSSSSFAVGWKTDLDTHRTLVLYGTDRAKVLAATGPGDGVIAQTGHTLRYGSMTFFGGGQATRVHEAHVCGLAPDSVYYYKVGAPGHWSGVFDLATAPEAGSDQPFRVAAAGDSRDDPAAWAEVMERIAEKRPDFMVFTGDAVAFGENQREWDDWFNAKTGGGFGVGQALARTPFMTVNGNHENLAVNYFAQFAFPQEISENELAEGEQWYSFEYGNALFLMLDSQLTKTRRAQREWMQKKLAAVDRKKTPWVFVVFHHAIYSCSNHGSDLGLRAIWQPVFDEFKVDLVLMGHDHVYERSVPIRGISSGESRQGRPAQTSANAVPVAESGTLYVVSGGAGAPLYAAGRCYHTHISEKTRGYVLLDIDGRRLRYRAIRIDGSEIERFDYEK
jgi:acid phosphatase type 7